MEEKDMEFLEGIKSWLGETKDIKLEEMDQFFAMRVHGYEEHMSQWKVYYEWMAEIIAEDVFIHFDTPLTLKHEINLMKQAGFEKVELIGYKGDNNTPMIVATKMGSNC